VSARVIYPAFACFLDGAAAIADDESPKIQRCYGGYSANNGGSALQCVIGNLRGEKFLPAAPNLNNSILNNDCCQKVLLPMSQVKSKPRGGTRRGEGIYRIASGKPKYRDHYQNKTVKRKRARA